ncbi:MAG: class I SAM-dependent methyltransferase [Myxococcales bacterium]
MSSRGVVPEHLDRCVACEDPGPFRLFMPIKGARGSEGEGVQMPSTRCPKCQLVFLNPRLPCDAVRTFYEQSERLSSYFTTGFKAKVDSNGGFAPFVTLLKPQLTENQRELFDIGCGTGALMRVMQAAAFQVAGAEISPSVSAIGRAEFGLDIMTAAADEAIERLRQQGRTFDVVTMVHTFEHLPFPLQVLEALRSILRPNGLVAINVPNVRFFLTPLDRLLGTQTAGIWDPVGHFSYFSLGSLGAVCQRAGYTVVARDSRLLIYGRRGLAGLLDDAASRLCRNFGGIGSNVTVIARR